MERRKGDGMENIERKRLLKEWADKLREDPVKFGIWNKKYAKKDKGGNVCESPEERLEYISKVIKAKDPLVDIDLLFKYGLYYAIFGGSITAGVNDSDYLTSLSNCTAVESPYDSYGGICYTDQEIAQLMKRRAGVGIDITTIRGKGEKVNNGAITSTGIVPFMDRYSNTTKEVAQDGRRGALMLSIDIGHPDIDDFINAKVEQGKVNNANISVKITNAFIKKVNNGDKRANYLLDKIVTNMHEWAEPGILFWDTIMNNTPREHYSGYRPVTTNPCGEIPLPPYDTCRIAHINLYSCVTNPFTAKAKFDSELFDRLVKAMVRAMDVVIDLEIEALHRILDKLHSDPEPVYIKAVEIALIKKMIEKAENGRAIGVGITGYTDAKAALYKSKDNSFNIIDIAHDLCVISYMQSIVLAVEKGAFPIWHESKTSEYVNNILEELPEGYVKMYRTSGIRNITLNTIAPVGTGSLLLGVTSGIEPLFNPITIRKFRVTDIEEADIEDEDGRWQTVKMIHKPFLEYMKVNGISDITDTVIANSPFDTIHSIDVMKKIKMQGAFQKWIDNSISITHNVRNDINVDTIRTMILEAHAHGCKGFTLYREGCKRNAILSSGKKILDVAYSRPPLLKCKVYSFTAENIKWVAIVSYKDNKLFELFMLRSKGALELKVPEIDGVLEKVESGLYNLDTALFSIKDLTSYYDSKDEEMLTRTITRLLQLDYPIDKLLEDFSKVDTHISSIVSAMKRVIRKSVTNNSESVVCDNCGEDIIMTEGCSTCPSCGSSNCG